MLQGVDKTETPCYITYVLSTYAKRKRNTMKQFWTEVLNLPYQSNSQDNPLHENQVRTLLDKYGYTYVYQPNGSQQSPDFRVTLPNGRVIDIECKSSQQTHPTYNGGLPKEGTIYIFSSKKYNETTVFFAEDVVSPRKRQLFAELVQELNSVLKVYQMDESWQDDARGFDFYIRNMYVQTGAGKKDYFKHPDRSMCEDRVVNFDY